MHKTFFNLNLYERVLLIYIFLRPLIEGFYYLRDISYLYSPLNISSGIIVIISFFYFIKTAKNLNPFILTVIIFLAASSLSYYINTKDISIALKLFYPASILILYASLTYYKSLFFLKIVMLSLLLPIGLITFEIIMGPIDSYTPGGRSIERYRGFYSDGSSYTMYWMLFFILIIFFYLKNNRLLISEQKVNSFIDKLQFYITSPRAIIIFTIIISAAIFYLSQGIAYIAFLLILPISIAFVFKKNKKYSFLLLTFAVVSLGLFYFLKGSESYNSIFRSEIEIIAGERELIHGINGRIRIWDDLFKEFGQAEIHSKLFGTLFSKNPINMGISGGAHNDYLRILFAYGIFGIIIYLLMLIYFIRKALLKKFAEKYLASSSILLLLILSLTLTPTFYINFMNIFLLACLNIYLSDNSVREK